MFRIPHFHNFVAGKQDDPVLPNYDSFAPGAKNQELSMNIKNLVNDAYAKDMLEEYVQGIYVYDDGRVGVEYK